MKNRFSKILHQYFDSLYIAMCNDRYKTQKLLVEKDTEAILLDCGCRVGDSTLNMAQEIGTRRLIGLDYNLNSLVEASHRGILALRSDLNHCIPLIDASVNVIIATDVIEHLINPSVFVEEMYRILKPGGYIILDTPNLASWHNIFALFMGMQPFSGPNITTMEDSDMDIVRQMHRSTHGLPEQGEYHDHDEQELTRHIVVLAYVSLVKLLSKVGFQVEQAHGFGYYPLPGFLAHLFERIDIRHTHHILIKGRKSV